MRIIITFLKYFIVLFTILVAGIIIGSQLPKAEKKASKHYPIEVKCYWSTDGSASYPTMEADSVKGDTIYKDGLFIVNKNILNVEFK